MAASASAGLENDQYSRRNQPEKKSVSPLLKSYYDLRKLLKNEKWKKKWQNKVDDHKGEEVDDHDDTVESKLLPFYNYRQILKNQRWKRSTDIYKPAYGFGKRAPIPKSLDLLKGLENYLFSPFHYQNLFMNSPIGKSFYNI